MIPIIWNIFLRILNPSCTLRTGLIGRNVKLGKKVYVGVGAVLAADSVGDCTYINDYCLIDKNVKSIGKFCSIAYNTRIGLGGHPTDWVSSHPFAYHKKYGYRTNDIPFSDDSSNLKTVIGNDVWIGANATILAGVTVGDGAIIGAHSLVTKDVAPYSIVVGAPARHSRYRLEEEQRNALLEMKWWDWPKEKIQANIELFSNPEKLINELKDK